MFKGGLSRTGMEEGEQFRYFAQQVGHCGLLRMLAVQWPACWRLCLPAPAVCLPAAFAICISTCMALHGRLAHHTLKL